MPIASTEAKRRATAYAGRVHPEIAHLRSSNYRRVAWNNGGGTTADIDRGQHKSGLAWRLSLADIERDGPFSDFTGWDRTIVLAEGHGFALAACGATVVLAQPYAVRAFDGAHAPMCRLLDGPARALNVMTAQATHRHDVTTSSLAEPLDIAPDGLLYVVVLRGGVRVQVGTEAALDVPACDTVRVAELPISLRASAGPAAAAVVRIRARA